jgi:hypothetical protein
MKQERCVKSLSLKIVAQIDWTRSNSADEELTYMKNYEKHYT